MNFYFLKLDFGIQSKYQEDNINALSFKIQKNLDLGNCDLRKNLDFRKIVATTDFLVHKLFELRKIF